MTNEYLVGQRDERPWGTWEIIATSANYAVKRIVVKPGPDELVFIEVQHGERLDENDIERIEDDYGRQ